MNPVSSILHSPVTSVPDATRDSRLQPNATNRFQNSIATNAFPREDVRPPALKLMKQVAVTVQSPNAATSTTTIQYHPLYYFEAFTGSNGAWVYDCLYTDYRIVTLCEDNFQDMMDEQEEQDTQESHLQADAGTSSTATSNSRSNK